MASIVGPSIASGVALVVGVGAALLNRRTALDAQRVADRSKALVRVVHIAHLNGQGEQDRIFNLTEARREHGLGRDPVTGTTPDPYAPLPREAHKLSRDELAEGAALVAAYGSREIDRAWRGWERSLEQIAAAELSAEASYFEGGIEISPVPFAATLEEERQVRDELALRIQQVLAHGRVRRIGRRI